MMSNAPPGPRGLKAYGFLGWGSTARAFAFLQRTDEQYGPVSMFRIANQGICLVNDAEIIKQILVTDQQKFIRDTGATLLRELVGYGLLTSDEPYHLERRRILQPAFHRAQVATYAQLIVAEAERLSQEWKDDQVLDIGAEMRRVTLAVVGSALFGVNFGNDVERIAEILRGAVRRSARLSLLTILLEPLLVAYRRRRPDAPSVLFAGERAELQQIIDPILRDHRSHTGRDLMSLMLDTGGLTEAEVRNETITMVLAGHETTAAALTWCFYLISTHAEVQDRLRLEMEAFSDRPPTLDDLPELNYTSMVFREALRLYPPALAFGRRPIVDIELGGYRIPARTSVLVSPYITQRNPKYFTEPERFNPGRWMKIEIPKFAYFPFGGGSKMCIGESFASLEGVLVLASLLRRWNFTCENAGKVDILPGITLGPDRNIMMRVRGRAPESDGVA